MNISQLSRASQVVAVFSIALALAQPAAALEFGELWIVSRSAGRADVFGIDTGDRSVSHMWQWDAAGPWVGPEPLSGTAVDLSAVELAEDRFEVFAAGSGNEILHSAQDYASWAWSDWVELPGQAKRVSAAKADDGTVGLFYVGTDDWYRRWRKSARWTGRERRDLRFAESRALSASPVAGSLSPAPSKSVAPRATKTREAVGLFS
jgi:hypothetical protein